MQWCTKLTSIRSTPAQDERIDSFGGYFIDEKRRVQQLALDHIILDLRMRPWNVSIFVDKSVVDLVNPPILKASGGIKPLPTIPETQMEVEPKITCGALMLQVYIAAGVIHGIFRWFI